LENTESTMRPYDLRQREVALGWPIERVIVIDSDLGQSAATAADREDFRGWLPRPSLCLFPSMRGSSGLPLPK
jgi:hypothetical protein